MNVFDPLLDHRDGEEFQRQVSRIDAIYFSLGTLTTAGTGWHYSSTSDLSKALVSGRMAPDLIFVAVVVTIAVTRWSERSNWVSELGDTSPVLRFGTAEVAALAPESGPTNSDGSPQEANGPRP